MSNNNVEKVVGIDELIEDCHNLNKGTAEGEKLIEKSFSELGAGRSILLDKDNNIIAGNKSALGAKAAGIKKVRVIETDGDVLVAVKRTDMSLDSKEGRELALLDNATHELNMSWDKVELMDMAEMLGHDEMEEWGFDLREHDMVDTDTSVVDNKNDFRQCPKCGFRWKRR